MFRFLVWLTCLEIFVAVCYMCRTNCSFSEFKDWKDCGDNRPQNPFTSRLPTTESPKSVVVFRSSWGKLR
jgi:hypothetical protein